MKQQSIKRENLKEIFDSISPNCAWRTIIQDLIIWDSSQIISINEDLILKGYSEANNEQKEIIKKYFKINTIKPIEERITCFNDILKETGTKLADIIPYKDPKNKREVSINAYAKLQFAAEFINGAKEEDWINWEDSNQKKHYPWFETNKQPQSGASCSCYRPGYSCYISLATAAYFKDEKSATFAGKILLPEYIEFSSR